MPKIATSNKPGHYLLLCPGCDGYHAYDERWIFNGSVDKPTFTPSYLAKGPYGEEQKERVCHSFVTDGKIQYLEDCTHSLAGQTIDVPEFD